MSKICGAARALAVLLAIVGAFVTIPYLVAALLILGAIADITNTPEQNTRIFLITIVLFLGAKVLGDIPGVGTWLSAIFSNIGTGVLGTSIMAIVLGLYVRVKSDWVPASTT